MAPASGRTWSDYRVYDDDDVARPEDHDVTGDDVFDVDGGLCTVSEDLDVDADLPQQGVDSSAGVVLLPEAEQSAGHDDGEDDGAVGHVTEDHGHDGGSSEDADDRARELCDEESDRPVASRWLDRVRPVLVKPALGLGGRQSHVGVELGDHRRSVSRDERGPVPR